MVTADIVGSTEVKARYGQATAVRRIHAALDSVREDLCAVDKDLHCPTSYAGDSILLVNGTDAVAIYKAAVIHQAIFRAWHYATMPVKISIGYGVYESAKDHDGREAVHGTDLDLTYAINAWCPPAGIVVTQSVFALLEDAGHAARFHPVHERVKGFGRILFHESNGNYVTPRRARRQYAERRSLRSRIFRFLERS